MRWRREKILCRCGGNSESGQRPVENRESAHQSAGRAVTFAQQKLERRKGVIGNFESPNFRKVNSPF